MNFLFLHTFPFYNFPVGNTTGILEFFFQTSPASHSLLRRPWLGRLHRRVMRWGNPFFPRNYGGSACVKGGGTAQSINITPLMTSRNIAAKQKFQRKTLKKERKRKRERDGGDLKRNRLLKEWEFFLPFF